MKLEIGILLAGLLATSASAAPAGGVDALKAEVTALARLGQGSHGEVGVAAWRLDGSGPTLLVNADDRFPMASTFKVAVAGTILKRIEEGRLSLETMVAIDQDRKIDSPVIAEYLIHPGVSLSIYNLLELMLTQSDNTATDYLLEAAGGPAAVTAWVRSQGVEGLRVDGGTDAIIRRFYRLGPGPFPQALAARIKADPSLEADSYKPDPEFDADPRDTATPRAMGELLTRIFSGRALGARSTELISQIMIRDKTGLRRLRGLLPPDTEVADKTGTIGGTVNDVGVITLPDGAGRIVVVVDIKASDASMEAREKCIAEIARSVRDFYLFAGRSGATQRSDIAP